MPTNEKPNEGGPKLEAPVDYAPPEGSKPISDRTANNILVVTSIIAAIIVALMYYWLG
jgi:hypothetical protein